MVKLDGIRLEKKQSERVVVTKRGFEREKTYIIYIYIYVIIQRIDYMRRVGSKEIDHDLGKL